MGLRNPGFAFDSRRDHYFSTMKRLIPPLLGFVLLLSACSHAPATAEEFGKVMFEAVKGNNEKTFRSLYLTAKEYDKIIDESSIPEDQKNKERGRVATLDKAMERLAIESFESLNRVSDMLAIDWNDAKFIETKVTYGDQLGIHGAHYIDVVFESKGFKYELNIGDCFETKDGWKTFKDVSISNHTD